MPIVQRIIRTLKREWPTMWRFVFVGGTSVLLKVLLYALLSRIIWTDGPRRPENAIALLLAQTYNYFMNRFWTFGHQKPAPGSLQRYLAVVAAGVTLDAGFFYLGHKVFGLYDIAVTSASSLIISMFTFMTHRLFTFHSNPYKRKTDVVQSD